MRRTCTFLLIAIGLLNLFPVVGVFSADQITGLYGIRVDSADLETLMRHRAIMLGLIGGFLLFAAFRPQLQLIAASMGLVSMSSFVVLACLSGEVGAQMGRVVAADIAGSIAAVLVLVIIVRERRSAA